MGIKRRKEEGKGKDTPQEITRFQGQMSIVLDPIIFIFTSRAKGEIRGKAAPDDMGRGLG